MISERERKQAIKEIVEDFDDLQLWLRSLYLDGLDDQELKRLNYEIGQAWLIVFKARKKYGSINDPHPSIKAPVSPGNAPRTQDVPIPKGITALPLRKENAKRDVETLFKEIKKATRDENDG